MLILKGYYFKGILLFLFFTCNYLHGQIVAVTDSLKEALLVANNDSMRITLFLELASQYQDSDSLLTIQYSAKARALALALNDPESSVKSLLPIANMQRNLGNYDEAKKIAQQIILDSEEIGFSHGKGYGYKILSNVARLQGAIEDAIFYGNKSLSEFELSEDQFSIASMLNNLGLIHGHLGKYTKALELYFQSLKIFEEFSNRQYVGKVLNSIGMVYKKQGDYDNALTYYNKALTIQSGLNNLNSVGNALKNIGDVYLSLHEYEKSIEYYDKAAGIFEELGIKKNIGNAHLNRGEALTGLNKNLQAISEYELALSFYSEIGDEEGKSYAFLDKGLSYSTLGDLTKAKFNLERAVRISEKIKFPTTLTRALGVLADVENKLGNSSRAYQLFVRQKTLSDSLTNENSLRKIAQLEAQHEYAKREQQLVAEKKESEFKFQQTIAAEKSFQTMLLLIVSFTLVLSCVIVFAYFAIKGKKCKLESVNEELNSRNIEIELKSNKLKTALQEKEVLVSEIHHRTKNNFLLVQSLLGTEHDETDNKQVKSVLRSVNARLESIRLTYEILDQDNKYDVASLNEYIEKLSKRIYAGFTSSSAVELTLDLEDTPVDKKVIITIGLIINEVLTNSFKHAFGEVGKGKVVVRTFKSGQNLNIDIHDNGKGILLTEAIYGSRGITLIAGLVRQMDGEYEITNDNGTYFHMQIPLATLRNGITADKDYLVNQRDTSDSKEIA
ncbi:MAG: tetratricopeptide repeat protein [Bacteroidota bacterium]